MLDSGINRYWKSYEYTITANGYKNVFARILGKVNGTAIKDNLGPVLLWHGEYGSGDDWLLTATKTVGAVPTRLWDSGYDVWIAYKRGTYPAKGHRDTSTHNAAYNASNGTLAKNYWNFTS